MAAKTPTMHVAHALYVGDDELLTPAHLLAQAQLYDVDLADEPFLIPLMKQAATTPLPPHWVRVVAVQEDEPQHTSVSYENQVTGQVQASHPAESYFSQQILDLRTRHELLEDGSRGLDYPQQQQQSQQLDPTNGWMEFDERCADSDDGARTTKYYYDFVSATRQELHPLVRLRDSASSTAAPVADPQVFARATTLHKQKSMMDLEQLEILCFHSWWTELSLHGAATKRLVHIYFSIPTRHFQVVLEDSDNVFTISHIVGPTGRLLSAWDLHVGARITVLGRTTTLMQASLLTRQWLAHHEQALSAMKLQLQTELAKYELKDHGRPHKAGRIECADPHRSQSGCSLRQVLNDIADLKRKLAGYRPDLVRRICTGFVDLDA